MAGKFKLSNVTFILQLQGGWAIKGHRAMSVIPETPDHQVTSVMWVQQGREVHLESLVPQANRERWASKVPWGSKVFQGNLAQEVESQIKSTRVFRHNS